MVTAPVLTTIADNPILMDHSVVFVIICSELLTSLVHLTVNERPTLKNENRPKNTEW